MVIFRLISVFLIVAALMLLGADMVTALEHTDGMIPRSLNQILILFGFDLAAWLAQTLPLQFAELCVTIVSWPGWAVIGVPGLVLGLLTAGRGDRRPPKPTPPIHR